MPPATSTMLPLGTPAPDFALPDFGVRGEGGARVVGLADLPARPLVVAFICNHCPFVVHIQDELARLGRDCEAMGVSFIAINSNNAETHPDDGPAKMTDRAREAGYTFPYLFDESQRVARAFGAACTPDFYLFDGSRRLVYRGQLDESRPKNGLPVTGADLRAAIDAVVAGEPVNAVQRPSIGCSIKWKPGNEPA